MKQILKHIILASVFLNVSNFSLVAFGSAAGAAGSALGLISLFLYYFFIKKSQPALPLLILGILYFSIGGFSYIGSASLLIKDIFRYFLFIFSITEVVKNSTNREILFYLLLGAISVIIQALFISNAWGRYGGIYLNPNGAGLICIIGFAFTYTLTNKKHKLIAQFIFTIAGLATLSRTFILLLVLVNVMSIFANRKNAIGLLAGVVGFIVILNTPAFELNTARFGALQSIFSSDEIETKAMTTETRNETWALYTDVILNNITFGTGYGTMQGQYSDYYESVRVNFGVHNTYLMVLGESGIIPFIFIVLFYLSLLIKSIKRFSINPEYTYLVITIILFLMASHFYFHNYVILFVTVWLYTRLSMNIDMDENKLKNE